ncbi:hypothetical protein NLX83_15675 [Allokutzneria sp. A3M-2-11 16]|uniref:BTAD domain-containing putative transcriptional regulator n=1 Tax=Allokutzneria sp. A3M-2-11 16 TaxID=2962043 RepID=UPI0020B7E1ED|nr:BTAD domain-containing putative transcriptional regulator [Allokutzneria sp. A3M-2-11 16]MCP3800707.1 hypothetical protein [Allokutzneria sp. A3M-2-11 16]
MTRQPPNRPHPEHTARAVFAVLFRLARGLLAIAVLLALVVGIPYALVRFVGSPLPDRLPTWLEIETVLLSPMSPRFLLDVLALLCWIVWSVFTLDVLRCSVEAARGITQARVCSREPLRRLAAALIGTIVLALVGNRAVDAAPSMKTLSTAPATTVVTAPLTPGSPERQAAPPGMVRVTEDVRPPQGEIHDSLWRIAERVYGPGSGSRWPELYRLNRDVEQADGRALTNPHLVRPGWMITAHVPVPPPPQPRDEPSPHAPPASTAPPHPPSIPSTTLSGAAPPTASAVDDHGDGPSSPGLNVATGAFVSLGLAGVIATAVASTAMWRRRRYRIGSGERADLQRQSAPVIRSLRAHHANYADHQFPVDTTVIGATPGSAPSDDAADSSPGRHGTARLVTKLGVRGGREIALDLAACRGLGLTGPGAPDAARALLLHLLTEQRTSPARILIPANDLEHLVGPVSLPDLPYTVHVVGSLNDALAAMDTTVRARTAGEPSSSRSPSLVLLARPTPDLEPRLQQILDHGTVCGLTGIFLSRWRTGVTLHVLPDGTVNTARSAGVTLDGARLFALPAEDTSALLAVLRDADDSASEPTPVAARTQPADTAENPADEGAADIPPVPGRCPHVETTRIEAAPPLLEPRAGDPSEACPLAVRVLGHVQLAVREGADERELVGILTPRQREVLVHLALHPQGVRRDVLNDAVWPDSRPPRPYNSLHTTMSTLRRALNDAANGAVNDVIVNYDGRYRLNDKLVTVDLWHLQHALRTTRAAEAATFAQLGHALQLYRGDLAEDVDALWIEPFREALRRDALDALGVLIRAQENNPETMLQLLEHARSLDRYNESVYRDIMTIQVQLGRVDAIGRTLALAARTFREIDLELSAGFLEYARSITRTPVKEWSR